MSASVRTQLRAEILRARRLLARGAARVDAALLALAAAVPPAIAGDPAALLDWLAGPGATDEPPEPEIDADPRALAAIGAIIGRPADAIGLTIDPAGDPLPEPGTRADRPAVDPADALRLAADRAIQRRRTSAAPLPMEVLSLYYGELLDAIQAHAPGAAFPDRSAAEDGWGPAHREWREAHPAAAVAMDRVLAADPHSAEFAAAARDAIGAIARGETVIDSDDI